MFPTRCNFTQFIYFWKTALHVSGGISTHQQEHIQLYLQYLVLVKRLLLPAAIVDYWSSFPEINELCKVASFWKHIKRNILTMHVPLNVKVTWT